MTVDVIGGGSSSTQQAMNLQQSSLSQTEFLKILLAQLQFQDPLKPMDNEQFLAQMAQFSALAQAQQTNDKTDTLLSIQSASQSIGLIGKTVEVQTSSGAQVGTVSSLSFSSGQPVLTISGSSGELITGIRLSQISIVR